MGWIDCFVITLIFCITTGYLIFLLHVRGWLFISLFIVICCKRFAMVFSMVHLQCFYGDHITRAKLCKNFCVSDFLCNCLSLSLSLKSLAHVQFHITVIFIIKEASWCKIFKLILLRVLFVFQYFLNIQFFQSHLVQFHVFFRIAFFDSAPISTYCI